MLAMNRDKSCCSVEAPINIAGNLVQKMIRGKVKI